MEPIIKYPVKDHGLKISRDLAKLHDRAEELERLTKEFERTYFYTTGNFYRREI